MAHGAKGTVIYPNGNFYTGSFRKNLFHGKGVYSYYDRLDENGKSTSQIGDKRKYEGDWVDGKRTGNGTYLWKNGQKYEGDFQNGEITGYGKVIYPNGKNLCKHILSEDKSIGFRIPNNKFCLELISLINKPIVSTSANVHREAFPKSFSEINNHILKQVDYVVNLPRDNWSTKPSSVIKIVFS